MPEPVCLGFGTHVTVTELIASMFAAIPQAVTDAAVETRERWLVSAPEIP
jgi:hypothetical protein